MLKAIPDRATLHREEVTRTCPDHSRCLAMSDDALKIRKPLIEMRFCAAENNSRPIIMCVQRRSLVVGSGKRAARSGSASGCPKLKVSFVCLNSTCTAGTRSELFRKKKVPQAGPAIEQPHWRPADGHRAVQPAVPRRKGSFQRGIGFLRKPLEIEMLVGCIEKAIGD